MAQHQHLVNLAQHLRQMQSNVQELPRVARAKLEQLVAQGERAQKGPDGTPWPPVQGREGRAPVEGAKQDKRGKWRLRGVFVTGGWSAGSFDPEHHIHYVAVVEGTQVKLHSDHRGARYTRFGTKRMPPRPKVPNAEGSAGLGWWEPRLLAAIRAHLKRKGIKNSV